MSKTREKKTLITEQISLEKANELFAEYAQADAKLQKINAEKDIQITKIREKYQDKEAELCQVKEDAFEKLQHFALNNPDMFKARKSYEFPHGKIGFRTGTPKVMCMFKKWEDAFVKIKSVFPEFIRTKEEVDKEAIIANKDNEEIAAQYPMLGVKVVQEETFFVEPKKEEAVAA